jgi:hypothetical protein
VRSEKATRKILAITGPEALELMTLGGLHWVIFLLNVVGLPLRPCVGDLAAMLELS